MKLGVKNFKRQRTERISPRWKLLTVREIAQRHQPLLVYGPPYAASTKDLRGLLTDAERASAHKMPPEARIWLFKNLGYLRFVLNLR